MWEVQEASLVGFRTRSCSTRSEGGSEASADGSRTRDRRGVVRGKTPLYGSVGVAGAAVWPFAMALTGASESS